MTPADAVAYSRSFIGTPYKYSGNGPLFDCSGLVCEVLRAAGAVARDFTAFELFNSFASQSPVTPQTGALCFFGASPSAVDHVGICIDGTYMISAAGGDHRTNDIVAAQNTSAFVKIRPISYRKDFVCAFMPKY